MADLSELREESGPSLCQEVTNLTSALQEYQLMVQVSSQRSVGTRFWKSARAIVIMDGDQPISTSAVFFPSAGWSWHNWAFEPDQFETSHGFRDFLPASAGRSQSDCDLPDGWTQRPAAGAEEEGEGEEGVWESLAEQQGGLEEPGGQPDGQPGQERRAHSGSLTDFTPLL